MASWLDGNRPITIAILALGGEGGGVLADWIVSAAEAAGLTAQNTSVAGVAQRTGATVYYVEVFPRAVEPASGRVRPEPVLSIFPAPGEVDLAVASELMEAGRAIQRGFVTPDRTTLITSTSRVYSIDEKSAPSDGRVDSQKLLDAARRASSRLIAGDFMALAEQAGSVISASLFGAVAGSGVLPLRREQMEDAIRASGKGIEASLAAFALGHDLATASQRAADTSFQLPLVSVPGAAALGDAARDQETDNDEVARNAVARSDPGALVGPALRELAEQVKEFPESARSMILHGLVRTAVYQNRAYAERYLARLREIAAFDPDHDGNASLTLEAARHVALWMCYQDTIHVALQKTRRRRLERVRQEARARPGQLMEVHEFLHPQIDEITDTMPTRLGAKARQSRAFRRLVHRITKKGMVLNTTSVFGYGLLATMARMRPLRPRSLRFTREQEAIEGWLRQVREAAAADVGLAQQIIECQGVLKGYGATHMHGSESFAKLMIAARQLVGKGDAASQLAKLREEAMADEDGAALDAALAQLEPSGT